MDILRPFYTVQLLFTTVTRNLLTPRLQLELRRLNQPTTGGSDKKKVVALFTRRNLSCKRGASRLHAVAMWFPYQLKSIV